MHRALFIGFVFLSVCSVLAAEPFRVAEFDQKVLPMVERYCIGCHDTATAKGDFDLESFLTPDAMLANRKPWEKVVMDLILQFGQDTHGAASFLLETVPRAGGDADAIHPHELDLGIPCFHSEARPVHKPGRRKIKSSGAKSDHLVRYKVVPKSASG